MKKCIFCNIIGAFLSFYLGFIIAILIKFVVSMNLYIFVIKG